MRLIDLLLRSTLGNYRAPDTLSLALYHGKREITDNAYRRAEVRKGQWRIENDGQAQITVRFGPFYTSTVFDRVAVLRGDEIIEMTPFTSPTTGETVPVTAPQSTVYEHTYVARFVEKTDK